MANYLKGCKKKSIFVKKTLKKILFIRFSSIGDIVLTTPVVRCVKKQFPDAEIHFAVKKAFSIIVSSNPNIDKVHVLDKNEASLIADLKAENFELIIDLHHSLRSNKIKRKLKKPYTTFPKLNLKKWLLVQTKINLMPDMHVVERYFQSVEKLGVINDKLGCTFFIAESAQLPEQMDAFINSKHAIAIAVGSKHSTKQIPVEKLHELFELSSEHFILLGSSEDFEKGEQIKQGFEERIFNACGLLSIIESGLAVKRCGTIITGDTGLMHIASALNVRIISIWGNTVPAFGMYPYMPQLPDLFTIHEVEHLKCRPCSKLGFEKCPKTHFKCMMNQDMSVIASEIKNRN